MLEGQMGKHGAALEESPRIFFIKEEKRLKKLMQDYPNNEVLKGITPTSFLDSQFVSSQEKNYIISSAFLHAENIVEISTNVLKRFKHWFFERMLEELSSIFNAQVNKDSIYSSVYLNKLADESPENDYIILWWQKEGKVFIEQLDTLSIPYTLAGLHDGILLCDYSSKSIAYDSELEKLFSIAELFIWEWKLLEERHVDDWMEPEN